MRKPGGIGRFKVGPIRWPCKTATATSRMPYGIQTRHWVRAWGTIFNRQKNKEIEEMREPFLDKRRRSREDKRRKGEYRNPRYVFLRCASHPDRTRPPKPFSGRTVPGSAHHSRGCRY